MKLRKFSKKLDKYWALFKNNFLVAQDLWGRKQPGKVSRTQGQASSAWFFSDFISQLRGAPSRKDVSRRGPLIHHIGD